MIAPGGGGDLVVFIGLSSVSVTRGNGLDGLGDDILYSRNLIRRIQHSNATRSYLIFFLASFTAGQTKEWLDAHGEQGGRISHFVASCC